MRKSTFHPLPSETDENRDHNDSFSSGLDHVSTTGTEKNNKISLPPPPLDLPLSRSSSSSLQREMVLASERPVQRLLLLVMTKTVTDDGGDLLRARTKGLTHSIIMSKTTPQYIIPFDK